MKYRFEKITHFFFKIIASIKLIPLITLATLKLLLFLNTDYRMGLVDRLSQTLFIHYNSVSSCDQFKYNKLDAMISENKCKVGG